MGEAQGEAKGMSGGVELTDEVLDSAAADAEHGYERDALRPRTGPGRPPLGDEAAAVFHVRLDPQLRAALEARAEREGTTASEVARRALRDYVAS